MTTVQSKARQSLPWAIRQDGVAMLTQLAAKVGNEELQFAPADIGRAIGRAQLLAAFRYGALESLGKTSKRAREIILREFDAEPPEKATYDTAWLINCMYEIGLAGGVPTQQEFAESVRYYFPDAPEAVEL